MSPLYLLLLFAAAASQETTKTETQVGRYLDAATPLERQSIAQELASSEADVFEVLELLRRGRDYDADAPRGRIRFRWTDASGRVHPTVILVPDDYDPDVPLPVRVDLHGGMGAPRWDVDDEEWVGGWQPVQGQIVVLPAGWRDSMWWERSQAENLEAVLEYVKRHWNVDENRIALIGSSDGGVGMFFQAFRSPDRWSGYTAMVGPPDRLARDNMRPDGQMHLSNLTEQSFLLFYGEEDPLCPIEHIRKYLDLFEERGASIQSHVNAKQGHDLTLSDAQMTELVEQVFRARRDPLPDRVTWSTERTDRYRRRSWLVLDELNVEGAEPDEGRANVLPRWGTRIQLRGPDTPLHAWGRADARRTGNRVDLTTERIARLRLLISPAEFDLSQPILVVTEGQTLFEGLVQPSLEVLLRWAAEDQDPSLLFVGEVELEIP